MGENGKIFLILPTVSQTLEMTGFFGTHNAKFDDKGRVVIPSAIKSVVPADQTRFVIRKDRNSNCLEMFTWQEWEAMSQAVRAKLDLAFNAQDIRYWRTFMSNTITVVPDAKLGRITIPEEIRKTAGITKDVVFLGVDYKVEIWAKELFEDGCFSDEEFDQMSRQIAERA